MIQPILRVQSSIQTLIKLNMSNEGSQDDEEDSDARCSDNMERVEREGSTCSFRSFSPPADNNATGENDEWNDAPDFSTPHHHKRRGCNSAKLLHSPSQYRRRVLRRHSSAGSDVHTVAR